jgi:hypothetical protein
MVLNEMYRGEKAVYPMGGRNYGTYVDGMGCRAEIDPRATRMATLTWQL